jgi:microcystin-dependent protein
MSEPFIAEIKIFAGNFAPRNFAFCDGQLLPISQNPAMFSLVGTIYGGDGRTTFGLPDLRGRVAMHPGSGPGLTSRSLGQKGGTETNTLSSANLGAHSHSVTPPAATGEGQVVEPSAAYPAAGEEPVKPFASTTDASMAAFNTGSTGSSVPVNNIQPFQCVNFIVALAGLFPSRN